MRANRERAFDAVEAATEKRATYQESLEAIDAARDAGETLPRANSYAWAMSEFDMRAATVYALLAIDDTLELVSTQLLQHRDDAVRERAQRSAERGSAPWADLTSRLGLRWPWGG
jgi:hypothetical protein